MLYDVGQILTGQEPSRADSRADARPLLDPDAIGDRQDGVAWLAERDRLRGRLRDALRRVRDLERILAKAMRPGAVPKDLGVLRASLAALPEVTALLAETSEPGTLIAADGTPPPDVLEPPAPVPVGAPPAPDAQRG